MCVEFSRYHNHDDIISNSQMIFSTLLRNKYLVCRDSARGSNRVDHDVAIEHRRRVHVVSVRKHVDSAMGRNISFDISESYL